MSLSMYQASVPVFARGLTNLKNVLVKGQAHAAAKKIDEAVFINARLFPVALPVRLFQRLTGRALEADLRPPAEPVNRVFLRLFTGEARRLSRQGSRGYPFGLSVFGVGTA